MTVPEQPAHRPVSHTPADEASHGEAAFWAADRHAPAELPARLVADVQRVWEQDISQGPEASLAGWQHLLDRYGPALVGAALTVADRDGTLASCSDDDAPGSGGAHG